MKLKKYSYNTETGELTRNRWKRPVQGTPGRVGRRSKLKLKK